MRKALVVVAIVSAGAFLAHGAAASRSAAPSLSGSGAAVSVQKGLRFPIDYLGRFSYELVTAPGLSTATATVNSGFAVEGGKAEFSSPPRTVLRDTASGLVVTVTFNVTSISGTPALVVHGATVTPR